jgi:hypothetical protein
MNRFLVATLGLLSIAPLVALALILFVLLPHMSQADPANDRMLIVVVMSFVLFGLLVMIFYVLFALRSQRVPQALKRRWTSRLLIGSLFTMPVFWYLFIWKDRPLEQRPRLDQYISGAA